MRHSHRNEATKGFAQTWDGDSKEWNHDQRMVAAGVNELFLQTTATIIESDLRKRIHELISTNPEAYSATANEQTLSGSRTVKPPLNPTPEDEATAPPNFSKEERHRVNAKLRARVTRLRNQVIRDICHIARGEALDAYEMNPEFYGMEEPFGPAYDRLARIHDHQQLLHTKLTELGDATSNSRIMAKASQWTMGTSPEDAEELLGQIQHALKDLERESPVTESVAMTNERAASAIRQLRVHLGKNNAKVSKGIELYKFGGAVDLTGPRSEKFQDLLSSEHRQFAVARMLAELDSQDVKTAYHAFAEGFADLWNHGAWPAEDCDAYEEGLIKQERLVSEALKHERQHKATTQPSGPDKSSRSSLPPFPVGKQSMEQETQTRRRRTESASLLQTQPTSTGDTSRQSRVSLDGGSQHNGTGVAAHERIHGLAVSNTTFLQNHSHPGESTKLAIRLDPAGVRGKAMSRYLRWSPGDTRTFFLDRVAELFPGKAIQKVNARLPQGMQVIIQATGPEGEWEMVQEEWLKQLKQPLKKEPSAAVYLVEAAE